MNGVIGKTEYKLSSKFDSIFSFQEILDNNKDCKVVCDATHSFDVYNGYQIHVTAPGRPEYEMILGVCSDGINYEGDGRPYSREKIMTVPIEKGIEILMNYWKMMDAIDNFESSLSTSGIKNDSINWFAACNYEAQHRIEGARNMKEKKCEISLYY